MKKLLMTGAAFLLMAGMGTTASASEQNVFLTRNVMQGLLQGHHTGYMRQHHTGHLQQHTELSGCVFTDSANEDYSLAGTDGIHHLEADDDCAVWTHDHAVGAGKHHAGDGCHIIIGADGLESCHIADGHCMMWTDADADDLCDVCGYPVCYGADGTGTALQQGESAGSATQQNGSSAQQGNGGAAQQGGSSTSTYQGSGCGGSTSTHHGSGHHGSGHH